MSLESDFSLERTMLSETAVELSVPSDFVELEKPGDFCGVVGIIKTEHDPSLALWIRDGLETLQHRGEEAAGVAVLSTDGVTLIIKDEGLVKDVMGKTELSGIGGQIAIGHVRYGTVGVNTPNESYEAAQPAFFGDNGEPEVSLAHNGDFTNVEELCEEYDVDTSQCVTDSVALVKCLAAAREKCDTPEEAISEVLSKVQGAFSMAIITEGKLFAVRDPFGFRPLMIGTYQGGGYAVASESHTIETMGAQYRREVARGEMSVFEQDGSMNEYYPFPKRPSKLCAFEFVYFSAPHGDLSGRNVHTVRKNMGRELAIERPVDADVVVGVPDSGLTAAEGFSLVSGLPKVTGLIKNRYRPGRTFIQPGQENREIAVRKKLQVITPEVYGKRVVLVDDSIVRGTTMKNLVAAVRRHGATEVHLRISSAPYRWPCFFGMDTKEPDELLANKLSKTRDGIVKPDFKRIKEYLEVDSLGYLSLEGLRNAAADSAGKLCMACMDGRYPSEKDPKELLEG